MLPINQFKQQLHQPQTLWGLWLGLPDTSCAEICGSAGFDWVLIDGEHASFDLTSIKLHLQALAPHSASPIVRAEEANPTLIKRLLDIGAQTLLLPMINTKQQAEQAVRAAYYPPMGERGIGAALARASQWNRIRIICTKQTSKLACCCKSKRSKRSITSKRSQRWKA